MNRIELTDTVRERIECTDKTVPKIIVISHAIGHDDFVKNNVHSNPKIDDSKIKTEKDNSSD